MAPAVSYRKQQQSRECSYLRKSDRAIVGGLKRNEIHFSLDPLPVHSIDPTKREQRRKSFKAGNLYVNVHSVEHKGRTQIKP
jgi:hypothetical protein